MQEVDPVESAAAADLSEQLETERARAVALEEELTALQEKHRASTSQAAAASGDAQEELRAARSALSQAESSREEVQDRLAALEVGCTLCHVPQTVVLCRWGIGSLEAGIVMPG